MGGCSSTHIAPLFEFTLEPYIVSRLTDFFTVYDGARVNVTVPVNSHFFQVLDHPAPFRITFERIFETFSALVAQGPGVFLADRRVQRPDDVGQRHAAVLVQLA